MSAQCGRAGNDATVQDSCKIHDQQLGSVRVAEWQQAVSVPQAPNHQEPLSFDGNKKESQPKAIKADLRRAILPQAVHAVVVRDEVPSGLPDNHQKIPAGLDWRPCSCSQCVVVEVNVQHHFAVCKLCVLRRLYSCMAGCTVKAQGV